YPDYKLRLPQPACLREMINSDCTNYGGSGLTNDWAIYSDGPDNEISLALAPFGSCIFRVSV
ncbi:MAG: alpha amylase C-terminal domain-containing protein, partial [Butyricicoccus sp.]|nr:alpha amylase C-terminal domain-containing protein [Butyricicoccus sp.]